MSCARLGVLASSVRWVALVKEEAIASGGCPAGKHDLKVELGVPGCLCCRGLGPPRSPLWTLWIGAGGCHW